MPYDPTEDLTVTAHRMNTENARTSLLDELADLRRVLAQIERDAMGGNKISNSDMRRLAADTFEANRYATEYSTLLANRPRPVPDKES